MTIAPTRRRVRHGVGESIERPDGAPKVRGEFLYGSDLRREGMLFGATLRSPHPHARILGIDVSPAKRSSGVKAVITSAELPTRELFGLMKLDQPVLASGRVRYIGEPVAIVAAETAEEARVAARAIEVRYESLAPITDPVAALQPSAEMLHARGNVIEDVLVEHGNPKARADVVVEGEYELGMQDQAALGPEAGLAIPRQDGGVDLHVATQWLHEDLRQIAPCLGLPESKVRLVLAGVGGAFGAREDVTLQIHTCLLALATKRPVRMTYGREESFYGHVHRHPAVLWYTHGANRDGDLVFVRATIVLDGGAYASSTPAVVANAACFGAGPYRVPNARVRAVGAYTNNPPTGAMRGFGAVQSCFAYEAQMDKLAAKLGMDPVGLRVRNGLRNGDRIITNQPVEGSAPIAEIVRRCADLARPDPAIPREPIALPGGLGNLTHGEGVRRGVGYAAGLKNVCYSHGFDDFSTARVRLARDEDGPYARVHTAAAEVGQGIVTLCVQIVRTELGVERVLVDPPDTTIGSAGSSSASRQTWMTGGAVLAACREVKTELVARAHRASRSPDDLAALLEEPIDRTVTHRHRDTEPRNATTQNQGHVAFLFAAHRAVVDVDVETGLVKVVQIATAQDVGKALNPVAVVGQIEGGIAQGLGLAVMEEVQLRNGQVRNASFTDYLLPTTLDMPPVLTALIEHPHPDAPYGAKGVGEPPTISSTPAIVAAIRAATGRELNRVPVRPDDIVFGVPYRSGWRVAPGEDPRRAARA
ncbi:MAG TPA: molybdopterin cofactor-binding domain-containing protein [Candidatus Limnocylindria bacterium]|jgi:CO/xanthine dehydrogenase Mo-binding subunit|nr:molybdopterin cofactor-binding domain-containing protein [Candidatus Limnocylindria bacterium]